MPARALRLAHRGDWRTLPENSLAALAAAARLPAVDGVEFDVRLSGDRQPVILHDETLQRVQGVRAHARDLSADELAAYRIPRLADVLTALPRSVVLDIDVKEDIGSAGVEVLAAGRGSRLENALVSSFVPAVLAHIHALAPAWPLWLNAVDLQPPTIELARDLGCRGVSVQWRAIDARSVDVARAAGLEIGAWTVTRRPTYRRLASLGVGAVIVEGAALDS